jgi:5-methylcytosine-specific restriction endonuclease McrA
VIVSIADGFLFIIQEELINMAKEWAKAFYDSKAWQQVRELKIQLVHGLCERCLKKGIIKPGKIVHHTVELTPENINNPEIALNIDLLEYDCQDCHNREHHGNDEEVVREGLMFNEYGDLVRREE